MFAKICTQVRTVTEKTRRTTKEDLKTLVTMLTMVKILKTMNKTNTSQNSPCRKGKSADSKGIKAEDLKGANEETTKMIHEIFKLVIKQNSMTASSLEKRSGHSDLQERRPDKTRKLQVELFPPTTVQTFLHHDIQQTLHQTESTE